MWVDGLWKGIVWEKKPNLFYIGMQDQFYTFNMFGAQAWFARDVIMGKIQVPSQEEVDKNDKEWKGKLEAIAPGSYEGLIYYQGNYTKDVMGMTDYPNFDTDAMNKCFMDWETIKHENAMTYRDTSHKSLITGTQGVLMNKPWFTNYVDDLEGFLADFRK